MSSVLIPVIIVAVIGLVAGVILTVASKVMYVPVEQLFIDVREALPGANCGACGFAGCDDYAAALAADEGINNVSTAACPVGGADLAAKLASIMGVEAESADPKVAVVMCHGNSEVAKRFMKHDRIYSCKAASMFYGGNWNCAHGCLGKGDCAAVCDFNAITIEDGVAFIDRQKCVGCGKCVDMCPKHIIEIQPKKNLVYVGCKSAVKGAITRSGCIVGCIGCMKCQKVCKFDAITIENNLAKIDPEKCKNCGLCAKECPTTAIMNLRPKQMVAFKKDA